MFGSFRRKKKSSNVIEHTYTCELRLKRIEISKCVVENAKAANWYLPEIVTKVSTGWEGTLRKVSEKSEDKFGSRGLPGKGKAPRRWTLGEVGSFARMAIPAEQRYSCERLCCGS